MRKKTKNTSPRFLQRWLNSIERIGNRLPHPVLLFALLAGAVVLLSALCEALGLFATGELIVSGKLENTSIFARSLLNREGLAHILSGVVRNFTDYAPLGMVLTAMLGVGVAEQSGLMNSLLKACMKITPQRFLSPMLVFLGVLSNIASDAGYVVLIPLGAMLFQASGRHPIAGLAAAFAGVSGGFSANLLVGALDPMLAGITQTAVSLLDPDYEVAVMGNSIFLFASTFLITLVGSLITDRVVEPRLRDLSGRTFEQEKQEFTEIGELEKKGLKRAGIGAALFLLLLVLLCIPQNSFLRNEKGLFLGRPLSPLIEGVVPLIALLFFIPGLCYGFTVKSFKNHRDVAEAMTKAMADMASFVALAFVAAQFIDYFSYSNLGTILALKGAAFLQASNIGLIPLTVLFILFVAFMNLFMGSASAKWNILAPVFVPMFMLLGYSPELCQLVYRIGDSCTNIITPMMSYYTLILLFARRYDERAGIGTLCATMLPYSIAFLLFWTLLLILWLLAGFPIGIGAGVYYTM